MMMQQQQLMMMQSAMMGNYMNPMAMMVGGSSSSQGYPSQDAPNESRSGKPVKGSSNEDESSGEDDDLTKGPSNSISHPHYRPTDMDPIPGVTDRRFEGYVHRWFEEQGYGFVSCVDLTEKFGQDAFLHRTQKKDFRRGDCVTFGVFMNYRGKPQATELRRFNKKIKPPMPA